MTTIIIRCDYTEHLRFALILKSCIVKLDPTIAIERLPQPHILKVWENTLTADGLIEYTLPTDVWTAIKPDLRDRLSEDDLLAGWDYWDRDANEEYILF